MFPKSTYTPPLLVTMDKHFSRQNQSLFPLSAKPFTHAKAEAFAKTNASNDGKVPAKGFTPYIDMSSVKFFGPLDEVDAQNRPLAPSAAYKIRRAVKETFEEARQKAASEKAKEERIARVEADNKEHFARKRAEEAERQARVQVLKAERKARSIVTRAAITPLGKRKRHAVDQSTAINSDNGQTVNVDATGGTRIFHGEGRHRPIIIDSDDEEDLLPRPKRRCSSKNSLPEEAVDEKANEGSKSNSADGRSDSQLAKCKKNDANDADPSDDKNLIEKRRKNRHVRRESDKENTLIKVTSKVTTKARGNAPQLFNYLQDLPPLSLIPQSTQPTMKLVPSLLAAALALAHLVSSTGLEIDYQTPDIECTRKTQKGDKIDVHYRGTLQSTGKEFDSSYSRGTPLNFQLGAGRVIKGWDEGLLDMCIGEKRKLTIPPELGYGERSVGPIPGNSVLVFETELMGIKGVKKDEL
ncbi:hypothetical protein CLAIMM_09585 [Cladophialophora immunda]|nr:hypothetical protein CLAIMM_09585 [Cladophialophora immunda]